MKKVLIRFFFTIIIVIAVLVTYNVDRSYATELKDDSYIIVDSYEISGGEIIPGQSFEFSITLKNMSSTYEAQNVTVDIRASEGITLAYPSISQYYVGTMGPGNSQTISFKFDASESVNYGRAYFEIALSSNTRNNSVSLTVPVRKDNSMFSVLSVSVPETAISGDNITTKLYFKSVREHTLSNVVLTLYVDGEAVAESAIGNMSAGASKTRSVSFSIFDEGSYDVLLEISGMGADGEIQSLVAYSGTIEIVASSDNDNNDTEEINTDRLFSRREKAILGGSGFIILISIVGIVLIARKYR